MAVIILRTKGAVSTGPNVRVGARRDALDNLSIEVVDPGNRELVDIRRDPRVVDVAPPMPVGLIRPLALGDTPAAEKAGVGWGIEAVRATDTNMTGKGVTVAVLDSGIDNTHPAFRGVTLVQKDFTGEGDGDRNGHGTHCAGTLFGRDVGGNRIGVARGVHKALIGKVLDKDGRGSSDQIVDAVLWAVKKGAHVLSLSVGMDFPGYVKELIGLNYQEDLATSMALEGYRANVRLFDKLAGLVRAREGDGTGCVLVAAAGNESKRHLDPRHRITTAPPAEADGFVSVAAVQKSATAGRRFEIASFSNANARVAAPGVGIWSAKARKQKSKTATGKEGTAKDLVCMNGTSMATPLVAGVAALWAEWLNTEAGEIKASDVIIKLLGSAGLSGLDPADVGLGVVSAPPK